MANNEKQTELDKFDTDEKQTEIDKFETDDQETELDKLDIDELIEETEDEIKEEADKADEKEEVKEEKPKEEEKPKKKLPILLISQILLLIIIIALSVLSVLEYLKKPKVPSGYFVINQKIIYLSPQKISEVKLKEQIKTYEFNLNIAYEFPSIYGMKILSSNLYTKFQSKVNIPLKKLYEVIKVKIYSDFKKLLKNKYLEDIKDYNKKLSEIILNRTLETLKETIPDINMEEVKKNVNFIKFLIV